ncbi:MAG: GAF domain-containing sensor histidine kinase [Chloroflexota bacterium]
MESTKQSHFGLYPADTHRDTSQVGHTLVETESDDYEDFLMESMYREIHTHTLEALHSRNGELNILHTLMTAMGADLDLSTIPAMLKQLMVEQLNIPGGAIFLFDEANEIPAANWGISKTHFATVQAAAIEAAECYPLHGAPVLAMNSVSARLIDPKRICPVLTSGLGIQVIVGNAIRGMLYFFSPTPLIASPEQTTFYEMVGQQIGIALQKAQLDRQVRTQQQQIQRLSRRLVEVQETERRNIAHELHDEVGQSLTGLKLLLESADCFTTDGSNVDLSSAIEVVRDLLGQVHNLSLDLRPSILDDLGLEPALNWQFRRYTTTTHICVNFEHTPLGRRFAPEIETAAYRIVQEALTNVARYAGVKAVDVYVGHEVEQDEEYLLIKVEDCGKGFDVERVLWANLSTGVAGLVERAALLRGTLKIDSKPGVGTCITAQLPLSKKSYGEVK